MFCQIYKTSIKNLFRSFIFVLVILILIGATVFSMTQVHHSKNDAVFGMINDNESRYILYFDSYIITLYNTCKATVMLYIMPLFSIISTVIILSHNYGDEFFEIEKAAGISPLKYTAGRLSAILSINLIAVLLTVSIGVHFYVYTRGGVEYMGLWQYIGDSSVRILRLVLFLAMPSIIMYTGITYLVGTVFRNALSASIVSIGYVIAYYLFNFFFRNRITPAYFDYFSPLPKKLTNYLYYYGTCFFEKHIKTFDTSFGKAAICFIFLVGTGVTCILISYLLTRKRDK